jgi:hypothetical protein
MAEMRKVVFYGNSLFMAGVEASLKNQDGLEVIHIDASLPGAEQQLDTLHPAAVVFDLASPPITRFGFPFVKEHPGVPLIGLDVTSNTVLVLSCRPFPALTVDDLARVIQERVAESRNVTEIDDSGHLF